MNRADLMALAAHATPATAAGIRARLAALPGGGKATAGVATGGAAVLDTLEARFDRRWADLGGPPLVREYRFDPVRRWRFDRAHVATRVAVEVDGGIWTAGGGRHNRAAGYVADCTKLNAAAAAGWLVFRLTPAHLSVPGYLSLILRTIQEREGR